MVDDRDLRKSKKQNDVTVVLFVHEDEEYFWQYCEVFSHAVETGANAKFVIATDQIAPKYYDRYHINEPRIMIFVNSSVMFTSLAPLVADDLINLLYAALLQEITTVETEIDFHKHFNNFNNTIIYTSENSDKAYELYLSESTQYGILALCEVPKSFFETLHFDPKQFIVYHKNENNFLQFDGSAIEFRRVSSDLVNYEIDRNTMILGKRLIVTAIYDGDSRPDIPFLSIAKRENSPLYGYLSKDSLSLVENLLEHVETPKPFITILNYTGFYITEPLTDLSEAGIENYIKNEKIPKIYASEEATKEDLFKLVGTNYEEKIRDDKKNTLVFYTNSKTLNISLPKIEKFINYTKENKIDLRVFYINYDKNSRPYGFPELVGIPHIEFFPSKNHRNSVPVVSSCSVYSLMKFLEKYMKVKAPVELMDPEEEREFIIAVLLLMKVEEKSSRLKKLKAKPVKSEDEEFDDYFYYDEEDVPEIKPKSKITNEEL